MTKAAIAYCLKYAGLEQIGVLYGYLRSSGWRRSVFQKKPTDADGLPLPWYSYPFIHFLQNRLNELRFEGLRVFEFGSGNSTLWWSDRAIKVVSVEDNKDWHTYITRNQPVNVEYEFAEDEIAYIRCLRSQLDHFHVIIVDGSHRERCIEESLEKLTEDGILIVDNSDWRTLSSSVRFLKSKGYLQVEFYGMGPVNGHPWGTSIFYRRNNLLAL